MYDSAIHRQQSHISLNQSDEKLLINSLKTTCTQAVDALSKLPDVASSALGSADSNAEGSSMTESGGAAGDQRNVRMTVEDTANAYTGVILLLQTIGTMIVEGKGSQEVKEDVANGGCLKACLDLLAQAERKIPRITKSTEAMVSDTDTSKGTVGFMYIKRDIVRLVGALAYQDRQMQDKYEMTELFTLDVKEYAIVAVRNLLDKNSENQAIVEQLSPQGAVQHPVLEEIGVTTDLRDGKVNVRKA
ncbi:Ataxin-10 [Umbelopsis sp. WA50703]